MRRWLPVGVLAVVVLAGCMSAPTAGPPATPSDALEPGTTPGTTTGTATSTDAEPPTTTPAPGTTTPPGASNRAAIEVRGGRLPVDANATFDRLAGVLGTTPTPPGYVVALTDEDLPDGSGGAGSTPGQSFRSVMGVVPRPNETGSLPYRYPAMTSSVGVASVYPGDKPAGLVETILAHELVHYVQFREGYATELRASVPAGTTDGSFVYRSVLEGMAVYVTDAYVERHVPNVSSNSALYERIENVTPPGTPRRYGNSWYVFGADYAAARLESPTEFERLVEDPPTTSEQVIHGYAPGVEPPRPLSVSVAASEEWSAIGRDRKGEALLRVVLQNGVSERVADRAAAGWGNDSLVTLRSGEAVGYAWTIRWDDRANATEFEAAFRQYLDARGNRSGGVRRVDGNAFEVRRASPDTTVVLVGNRPFVTGTGVAAEGATVSVRPPGSNASSSASRYGTRRSGAVGVAVEFSKEVTRSGAVISRPQSARRRPR